jgi:hypothetical protein
VRRVWFRGAVLAFSAGAVIAGLTVYFSSAGVPPCLVSGAPEWQAPRSGTHRYMVVFPDRAACFFAIDDGHKLVGAVRLNEAHGVSVAAPLLDDIALRTPSGVYRFDPRTGKTRPGGLAPFPSDIVNVVDARRQLMYVTRPKFLGFRVIDMRTAASLYDVSFNGFTWNPRFGPNPPSHGLVLAQDGSELWVLDAPNSVVHVFDLGPLPDAPPRQVANIRLSKPLSGDESPCSTACGRIGSLLASADGRYVYVGDAGDVIDTQKREIVTNLDALHNSRVGIEVVLRDGKPSYLVLRG